jgi:hypothetical protein
MRFLPTMTRSLAIGPSPSRSVGTVGADMPGVNRICNTKMSLSRGIFELLLRRDAALRNIQNALQKGRSFARSSAGESCGQTG